MKKTTKKQTVTDPVLARIVEQKPNPLPEPADDGGAVEAETDDAPDAGELPEPEIDTGVPGTAEPVDVPEPPPIPVPPLKTSDIKLERIVAKRRADKTKMTQAHRSALDWFLRR